MDEPNTESGFRRAVFGVFLILVFTLGLMKPGVDVRFAVLTPTDLIFPLVFIMFLAGVVTGKLTVEWHPAYWSLLAYFGALLLSAIYSENPRRSFVKLTGETYLITLPLIIVSVVRSLPRLRLATLVWIAGAIIPLAVALFALFLFYAFPNVAILGEITYHYGAVPVGNFPRVSATFVSPSMFCNYLTVTLSLVAVSQVMQWISRRVAFWLYVLIGVAAVFTVSIALGGFMLAGGLLLWKFSSRRAVRTIALVLAIAGAVAFLAISPFELTSPSLAEDRYAPSSRLIVWSDAVRTFLENPFVGKGVGMPAASVAYRNSDGSWSMLADAHNTFLNVAAQAGVVGLIGFALVILSVLKAALRKKDESVSLVSYGLAIAFIVAFIYEGLTGSYEDARHLWVLIGLILAVDSVGRINPESQPATPLASHPQFSIEDRPAWQEPSREPPRPEAERQPLD